MDPPLVAVVLAGGVGTRLYPATRSDRPKQFLAFGGDRPLLARTVDRLSGLDHVVVSTRPAFADRVGAHAPDADVLVEPAPRDTGPALVYAATRLREAYGECVLVCLPSDHWIGGDIEPVLRRAAGLALDTGDLVAVGVEPDRPATAYGYIEPDGDGAARIERFVEKPDRATAERLVGAGCYWNAGMFAWTPDAFLREARAGELAPLVDAIEGGGAVEGFRTVDPVSVDYAVMERTDRARVVPTDVPWDDLGAWDAVGRVVDGPLCAALEIDASGNVIAGDGDTHVTVIGASDLVVAAYDDRVLVVPVDQAQRVREAVRRLP